MKPTAWKPQLEGRRVVQLVGHYACVVRDKPREYRRISEFSKNRVQRIVQQSEWMGSTLFAYPKP